MSAQVGCVCGGGINGGVRDRARVTGACLASNSRGNALRMCVTACNTSRLLPLTLLFSLSPPPPAPLLQVASLTSPSAPLTPTSPRASSTTSPRLTHLCGVQWQLRQPSRASTRHRCGDEWRYGPLIRYVSTWRLGGLFPERAWGQRCVGAGMDNHISPCLYLYSYCPALVLLASCSPC